jgi:hypothetical protein
MTHIWTFDACIIHWRTVRLLSVTILRQSHRRRLIYLPQFSLLEAKVSRHIDFPFISPLSSPSPGHLDSITSVMVLGGSVHSLLTKSTSSSLAKILSLAASRASFVSPSILHRLCNSYVPSLLVYLLWGRDLRFRTQPRLRLNVVECSQQPCWRLVEGPSPIRRRSNIARENLTALWRRARCRGFG